jgi:putative component of toxin-antitoxin plasmid stabilization module
MDYGAVVHAPRHQPALLRQWLAGIKDDFASSFQAFKLRRYAQGNPGTQRVVDQYISQCLGLVDRWMQVL